MDTQEQEDRVAEHERPEEAQRYRDHLEKVVAERTAELQREMDEPRQAEEVRRRREQEFKMLVENNPDMVARFDGECRHSYVNPAVERELGIPPEELLGRTHREVGVRAEQADWSEQIIRQIFETGQEMVFEVTLSTPAGVKHFLGRGVPEFAADGSVASALLIHHNITARKQAEALVRAQHDLGWALSAARGLGEALRLCVEMALRISGLDCGGVYLVDEASGGLDLAYHQGLSPEFLASVLHCGADAPYTRLVMVGLPTYVQQQEIEEPLSGSAGHEGLHAMAAIPVLHEGRVIACLNLASHTLDEVPGFVRSALETIAAQVGSVIAHQEAQEALRASEHKFRSFFEESSESIALVDEQGNVLEWNRGAEQITGLKREEILGRPLWEAQYHLLPEERRGPAAYERLKAAHQEALRTGQAPWLNRLVEANYCRADGTVRVVQQRIFPIKTAEGFRLGSISRDITELKQAEEELRAAYEQLKQTQAQLVQSARLAVVGELAAGVAHELNNPLTSVLGFAELLFNDLGPDVPFRQDLETIAAEARRARDIVRSLLDFARQTKPLRVPADVNQTLRETLAVIRYHLEKGGVTIEENYTSEAGHLSLDEGQMKQVFLNLISNAAHAMPRGGTLRVVTARVGDEIAVSVADTGAGIPPDDLPRVFDPFFTTKPSGTGLGLSVSLGIVQKHGGRITVESTEGRGSTFTVWLPLGAAGEEEGDSEQA